MLIFQNGTAYFNEQDTRKDIDEMGLPVSGDVPTNAVPCYIESSGEDRKGQNEDGKFPHGSFAIFFDYDSITDIDNFSPKQVKLQHERKGDLGTFAVQRYEFYDITRTVKVWV